MLIKSYRPGEGEVRARHIFLLFPRRWSKTELIWLEWITVTESAVFQPSHIWDFREYHWQQIGPIHRGKVDLTESVKNKNIFLVPLR